MLQRSCSEDTLQSGVWHDVADGGGGGGGGKGGGGGDRSEAAPPSFDRNLSDTDALPPVEGIEGGRGGVGGGGRRAEGVDIRARERGHLGGFERVAIGHPISKSESNLYSF